MEKLDVTIRSATKDDILQIQELLKATGLFFEPIDGNSKNYEAQLEDDPGSIVVAEYECHVVGMMFFVYSPLWSPVGHLAVLPEFQRRGVGTLIFQEVLHRLQQRGSCDISGYVEENNEASLGLCDSLGLASYPAKLIARYLIDSKLS